MKYIFVYITTNLLNGKQYVGDHSTNNLNDGYIGSGYPYFIRAIKEHGKENFKREILEFFDTKEEAFAAQEKYIIQYNTLAPNGYNISPKGGLHVQGCHSLETKEKISKGNRGISRNKGKPKSIETKDKIRNSLLGIKHTEERKQNMRKPHTLSPEAINQRKGRKQSKETIEKRKNSLRGRKRSEEVKQNIKNGWIKRKLNNI
jgi:group I intron endonuclease